MNKHNVLTALSLIVIFVTTYALITCAWVGAEYIFDGAVHTSKVDGILATAVAYYFTRDAYYLDRKYGRKKK